MFVTSTTELPFFFRTESKKTYKNTSQKQKNEKLLTVLKSFEFVAFGRCLFFAVDALCFGDHFELIGRIGGKATKFNAGRPSIHRLESLGTIRTNAIDRCAGHSVGVNVALLGTKLKDNAPRRYSGTDRNRVRICRKEWNGIWCLIKERERKRNCMDLSSFFNCKGHLSEWSPKNMSPLSGIELGALVCKACNVNNGFNEMLN